MNDTNLSPLSGLPLIQEVVNLRRLLPVYTDTEPPKYLYAIEDGAYTFYTGEPGGGWATNLDFTPNINLRQARAPKPNTPFQFGSLDLKPTEFERLKAYLLSIAVQARLKGYNFPLFVSALEFEALNGSTIEVPQGFSPYAVEELWLAAQRLSLSHKVHQTLLNLTLLEEMPGSELMIAVRLAPTSELVAPRHNADPEKRVEAPQGLFYGAVARERAIILEHLVGEGLIRQCETFNYEGVDGVAYRPGCKGIRITPKGYMLAEKISMGEPTLTRTAFLVCPFDVSHRTLFDETCKKVGDHPDVKCEIKPVWEAAHVEKIDDRIFRLIREATIVVVDLDIKNFNVALEAGYALALGKPIVWTRKEPWDEGNPFDIYSHMILKWSESEPEKFERELRNQVLAAFDKARSAR